MDELTKKAVQEAFKKEFSLKRNLLELSLIIITIFLTTHLPIK